MADADLFNSIERKARDLKHMAHDLCIMTYNATKAVEYAGFQDSDSPLVLALTYVAWAENDLRTAIERLRQKRADLKEDAA
jgi:hypothetical protein